MWTNCREFRKNKPKTPVWPDSDTKWDIKNTAQAFSDQVNKLLTAHQTQHFIRYFIVHTKEKQQKTQQKQDCVLHTFLPLVTDKSGRNRSHCSIRCFRKCWTFLTYFGVAQDLHRRVCLILAKIQPIPWLRNDWVFMGLNCFHIGKAIGRQDRDKLFIFIWG